MRSDVEFLSLMRGILTGALCACGKQPMPRSNRCEACATALKCHRVRGQWFALPNGVGSDVGPFSIEDEAEEWAGEGRHETTAAA